MAYVIKRGSHWSVGYTDASGTRVQRATKARTKTEARKEAEDEEREAYRAKNGLDVADVPTRIQQVADSWLLVAKARRTGTVGGTVSFAAVESRLKRHVLPQFGQKLLHEVRPSDVDAWLAAKAGEGLSPQTLRHIQNHVAALYRYASEQMRVYRGPNPGRLSQRIKVPERPPRYMEADAVGNFIASVPDQWRGIFATAVYTGLRKGEIFALRVTDVDADRRVLRVCGSYDGATKSGKARSAPIPEGLWPYIKAELGRVRSVWLFPGVDGDQRTPDTDLCRVMRTALRKAGMVQGYDHLCRRYINDGMVRQKNCGFRERRADKAPSRCPKCNMKLWVRPVPVELTFKDLRSTFATAVYESTGDIRATQRLLGHSDPRITEQRYAHARASRLQEFVNGLDFGQPVVSNLPATKSQKPQNDPSESKVVRMNLQGKQRHAKRK